MSVTQILLLIAIVWHLGLAALVAWLWWSRRPASAQARRPAPGGQQAESVRPAPAPDRLDPAAPQPTAQAVRPRSDIGASRLVGMIFRSHAVFPKLATEWRGTAGELIAALTGGMSFLPSEEKLTLPPPAALARRLILMSDSTGHYLEIRVEEMHDDLERVRFRLNLNAALANR